MTSSDASSKQDNIKSISVSASVMHVTDKDWKLNSER